MLNNHDALKNGYLSKGILGKVYRVVDFIGYKFLNRNLEHIDIRNSNKLLFINLGLIGDLIIFRYVIEKFLNLSYEVDILIQEEYKFIFRNCAKNVNLITVKNYKDKNIFSGFLKIITALRSSQKKYDVAYHFRGYLGTGILSTYLCNVAKFQIGYGTAGFGFLLNKKLTWRINAHESEHLLDVIRALNGDYNQINLDIFDSLCYTDTLIKYQLKFKEYIVIHATSQDSRKNITLSDLHRLLQELVISNLMVVFVGSRNEIDYIKSSFPIGFDNYIITNGTIDFFDIRDLVQNSKMFIGIDSSIAHLISNIKISKIVLWHKLNDFEQWKPLGANFRFFQHNYKILDVIKEMNDVLSEGVVL